MIVSQTALQTTLVFLQKDGQILLGKKQRGHGKGKWNGAGGKCKPHEWPEAAARREAREELG
ncbi:MAG TPA: NUDIX domain-containing protein, partial [Candidatus Saccharimonas sp.]|nr:NUDIX domain-containing protein [Candidatus Saccharimonas sp.]